MGRYSNIYCSPPIIIYIDIRNVISAYITKLLYHLCAGNRALFGKSGAVAPLVSYLQSSDLNVHITTTLALFQLSKDPWNCVTMHQHGVVTHLLRLIGIYTGISIM